VTSKLHAPGALRAFVAVEIPAELLEVLARVQADFKARGVRARWTRTENLHLTLKFLGTISMDHAGAVTHAMQNAAAAHGVFQLTAAGIGVFPGLRQPRVLWAGLSGATDALERLQAELDRGLEAIGYPREGRGFHGHLTLGRFSEGARAAGIAAAVAAYASERFGSFEVGEMVLFQSDLRPQGPVYTVLARAPLRGTS
jgi:RNA 2',3'-cyclic 3'-phosphodiesterase